MMGVKRALFDQQTGLAGPVQDDGPAEPGALPAAVGGGQDQQPGSCLTPNKKRKDLDNETSSPSSSTASGSSSY